MHVEPGGEILDMLLDQHQEECIEAYLAKGRPFHALAADALDAAWVAAHKAVAFGDDGRLMEWTFLGAELDLRRRPYPDQLVEPQSAEALRRRIADASPEEHAEVARNIGHARKRLLNRLLKRVVH